MLAYPLQMLDRYVDAIPTGILELQVLLCDSVCIEKSNPSVPTRPVRDVHDQVTLLEGKRMPGQTSRPLALPSCCSRRCQNSNLVRYRRCWPWMIVTSSSLTSSLVAWDIWVIP